MTRIYDTFLAGGIVMYPLLALSVITFAYALERIWFWFRLISQEERVVHEVLTAAQVDLQRALIIAERAENLAIGRLLAAPLKLKSPNPETFHLAIQAALDKEFVEMRKGDKLLESIITIAPLFGILGTASGLFKIYQHLQASKTNVISVTTFPTGLGEALISSFAGIALAIAAFVFYRTFLILRSRQMNYFSKVGSELELIYLQFWGNRE
jgi:biopolymer transport protein ExbB